MKHIFKRFAPFVAGLMVLVLAMGMTYAVGAGSIARDEIAGIVDTKTDPAKVTSPLIDVANAARESVVGINNYQSYYGYGYGFDNRQAPQGEPQLAGTGSGVVVSKYGHVLTNYHVVKDAERVTVSANGTDYDAAIVGTDSGLDIAILQVPGLKLPAVPLGDSDKLQVGEWAIVVGNPLGKDFERSVTVGVVSALNRLIEGSTVDKYGRRSDNANMIQVDAAISSGNSGGGMFNILGQLQGIPTLKFSEQSMGGFFGMRSGPSIENIGMCVPINAAKPLLKSVLESYTGDAQIAENAKMAGQSQPPKVRLGVTITTLSPMLPFVQDGSLPQGAYIESVEKGMPAEKAGIQPGDIVVEVDGKLVTSSRELIAVVSGHEDGDTLKIKLYRTEGLADIVKGLRESQNLPEEIKDGKYIDLDVQVRAAQPASM